MKSFDRFSLLAMGLLVCVFWSLDCSRPKSSAQKTSATGDSTAQTDTSSVQAPSVQAVALTYEQQQGKIVYSKYCTICHGETGKGDGFNAYSLDPKPRDFTDTRAMAGLDETTLRATVVEGGRGVNKSPLMPAWGGRLNKQEIDYVLEYVNALEEHR